PGDVYNIGSGHSVRIGDILSDLVRLSRVEIEIRPDSARMRPADTPDIVCDAGKLQALTNWQPEIELTQTLTNVLEYWRERVASDLRARE
ncbi:MAG: GDP-mannose 4,6 dehydratase, partial [Chloroflexi bacterium]|nr:GDP-mannose 4,6 dehydratase [Chloroflexota bacterium]